MATETEYYGLYNSKNGKLVGTLKGLAVVNQVLDDFEQEGYANIAPERVSEDVYHQLRKDLSDRILFGFKGKF
jgi:hypothetical protein